MAETPKNSETSKRTRSWWSKNWFYTVLIAIALVDGLSAFGLPLIVSQPYSAGDSISTLRQAILAATGGILAILTLWESRRKNIQEKEKNDQDHTPQVHAERRARYAKALEQLADAKAPVRLGGVYTLIKLVDEWLADEKTLPNEEERREEGQVIINSLCAYIRSPFDLASKTEEHSEHKAPENYEGGNQQFIKDQARFREEKELRLTILEAVRNRLNKGTRVHKNGTQKLLPGQWSGFDYDFSNTVFFYPVGFNNSYFGASSNFSGAEFTEDTNFSRAKFAEKADFCWAKFAEDVDFSRVKFTKNANFYEAKFTKDAKFYRAEFTEKAGFTRAKFTDADFSGAKFAEKANFSWAKFAEKANFCWAEFAEKADFTWIKFAGYAQFGWAKFTEDANFSAVKFTKDVEFSAAKFAKNASFSGAKFTKNASFSGAKFTKNAKFSWAKFTKGADFSWAEFIRNTDFFEATFEEKPIFEYELYSEIFKAKFSHRANPEDYNFKVSHNSPYKIETKEQEHNGIKFVIPKDAELFDPDEPSE